MQHSQRVLAIAFLALTVFTASPAFGNVLTVAPSGAQYAQIQDAVNAAGADDVILISPGVYGAVTIDGKSVTLCCKTSPGAVTIAGTTTVKNLTAVQRVILSGIRGNALVPLQFATTPGIGLLIENNAGHVRVEASSFNGAIGWGDNTHGTFPTGLCCSLSGPQSRGGAGAVVRNNTAGVSFVACDLRGGRGADAAHTTIWECICGSSEYGGDGLLVVGTLTSLYDSICAAGRGGNNGSYGGNGGAGCRTVSGTSQTGAFASGSTFFGGNGGHAWDSIQPQAGAGGAGLFVSPSTGVHLLSHLAVGGVGGLADSGGAPGGASGAPTAGGGSIFIDPETRLLMTTDRFARAGSVVDIRVQGTPGQNIHLLVSRTPTFQILASWRGTLLSLPGKGSVEVPLGPIPASGVLLRRYVAPHLPSGVPSSTVFVQAFRSDPVLGPKLAAGTSLILLP